MDNHKKVNDLTDVLDKNMSTKLQEILRKGSQNSKKSLKFQENKVEKCKDQVHYLREEITYKLRHQHGDLIYDQVIQEKNG